MMPKGLPVPAFPVPAFIVSMLLRRWTNALRDRLFGRNIPDPSRLVARIRARGGPLRIGFVVADAGKWALQPLWHALHADAAFQCGFICTLSDTALRLRPADRISAYTRMRDDFSDIGPIWRDLFDPRTGRMQSPDDLGCDIVFIQQPWGLQDLPRRIAAKVLCAYVPYGMPLMQDDWRQYHLPDFHPYLWRYFAPTPLHKTEIGATPGPRPPVIEMLGYPRLDAYDAPRPMREAVTIWPNAANSHRKRVIFAPHHGFAPGSLGVATYRWSGAVMRMLLRDNPGVDFVFRPHPNFAYEVTRSGGMTASDWAADLAAWTDSPNARVHAGPMTDVFRSADLLITDCVSYLAECLPSGAPILRLVSPGAAPFNPFGRALEPAFYTATDPDQLLATFAQIIARGEDPLAATRREKAALVRPNTAPAGPAIARHLQAAILGEPAP